MNRILKMETVGFLLTETVWRYSPPTMKEAEQLPATCGSSRPIPFADNRALNLDFPQMTLLCNESPICQPRRYQIPLNTITTTS